MKWILAAFVLVFAGPASAGPAVSLEEWHYLQRVGVISKVNEAIWAGFEDHGAWNQGLARYAKDATALNARTLRQAAPPARPLFAFHNALVAVLTDMELFYAAIASGNIARAHELGARIERGMLAVESGWASVQHRYASPASP